MFCRAIFNSCLSESKYAILNDVTTSVLRLKKCKYTNNILIIY